MQMCDLTGQVFGNLFVIGLDKKRRECDRVRQANGEIPRVRLHWICECKVCGRVVSVQVDNLKSGQTKDCGCVYASHRGEALKRQNRYYFDGDTCTIVANNTKNKFIIDRDAYDTICEYCWHETKHGYLASRISSLGKIVFLHRMLVFGLDDINNSKMVDHIDRDKTNCRRNNLRVCDPIENSRNKSITSRNSSGRIGVSYDKYSNKWRAFVSVKKKYISLGYYDSFEEAVAAREDGELKYYKEFAPAS